MTYYVTPAGSNYPRCSYQVCRDAERRAQLIANEENRAVHVTNEAGRILRVCHREEEP